MLGEMEGEVPRDPDGRVEPVLIPKHEGRFTTSTRGASRFTARGMTMRDVQVS